MNVLWRFSKNIYNIEGILIRQPSRTRITPAPNLEPVIQRTQFKETKTKSPAEIIVGRTMKTKILTKKLQNPSQRKLQIFSKTVGFIISKSHPLL